MPNDGNALNELKTGTEDTQNFREIHTKKTDGKWRKLIYIKYREPSFAFVNDYTFVHHKRDI